MIDRWDRDRIADPDKSRIILTHTNDEVRALNEAARSRLRDAGALGEDVTVNAERGDRTFATGDRLMFLRNDRDLGVKNGSLGQIVAISPQSIAVQLDDGRSIAFDTKNYAHIDHGYAATIHKSQGVTVDRTHVLATPGLDRHATYVALSRHREGAQVHYGRDDFADAGKLARTLSRERAKDMASDYKLEQSFAERRGINFRERIAEVVRKIVPEKARSIFANFRPPPATQRDVAIEQQRKVGALDMQRGVERYARANLDIERMAKKGLNPMPHQETALDKARKELSDNQPKADRDLVTTFKRQPELVAEAANGRTTSTIRAMQLEREIRTNPQLRADRFVENWQKLSHERRDAYQHGAPGQFDRLTKHMGAIAEGIGRDAQLESLLRNRTRELGISMGMGRDLTHELSMSIGLGRGRGLGI